MDLHYFDTVEIDPYPCTAWIVEFKDTDEQHLAIWHKDAKIEDIVEATKAWHQNRPFVVRNIDVGTFQISKVFHSMGNGRGINQDMMTVID